MKSRHNLLELSAEAAGIITLNYRGLSDAYYYDDPLTGREEWNPLGNDGQALRLMVKLKIDLKFYDDHLVAWFDGGYIGTGKIPYGDDPTAATRLAIVIAAAEVQSGKDLA